MNTKSDGTLGYLVLSRFVDEKLRIGDDVIVQILAIRGDQVRIGLTAPRHVPIYREEVEARRKAQAGTVAPGTGTSPNTEDK